jgi:hypothetical protein
LRGTSRGDLRGGVRSDIDVGLRPGSGVREGGKHRCQCGGDDEHCNDAAAARAIRPTCSHHENPLVWFHLEEVVVRRAPISAWSGSKPCHEMRQ